jgi:DNA-nicking Smr family endonuclease
MDFKIGDAVSAVHELITGKISLIEKESITILDTDGFSRKYKKSELSLKKSAQDYNLSDDVEEKEIERKLKSFHDVPKTLRKFEIDLHIEELVDSHSGMTNHEILLKQMNVCKSFIQNAIEHRKARVVIIHGKGEGVLKAEIYSYLIKLKNLHEMNLEFHDASYSEYGMGGATEITFVKR